MCPGSRVPAGRFEQFIADQIATMGVDDALLTRTAAAATRLGTERCAELGDEQRRLAARLRGDLDEAARVLLQQRLAEVEAELRGLGDGAVDGDRLALALSAFQPVWSELFPREQERILRLLIARVTYDPDTGDADIDLRPCGIETLAIEATP